MLNRDEILERIKKEKLIEEYIDLNQQLQPSSFDLTLSKVAKYSSRGEIDFDNKNRKISKVKEMNFKDGWIRLPKGSYKIQYNEVINVPKDLVGITICRSSLARCGCDVYNGFWDPGYRGRGEAVLIVHNPYGIKLKKNAKIAQIIFFKINEIKSVQHLYKGIHQNENIK